VRLIALDEQHGLDVAELDAGCPRCPPSQRRRTSGVGRHERRARTGCWRFPAALLLGRGTRGEDFIELRRELAATIG
jgi:hypothetical protein